MRADPRSRHGLPVRETAFAARQYDILCCNSGHPAYTAKRDIRWGEIVRAVDLEPLQPKLPVPSPGELIPRCTFCGDKIYQSAPTVFRFEDGRRVERKKAT